MQRTPLIPSDNRFKGRMKMESFLNRPIVWLNLGLAIVFFLLLYSLAPILPPFIVAMALAYLGDPIVVRLQKLGMNRTWAVIAVFAIMLILECGALLLLLPMIEQQVMVLVRLLPVAIENINAVLIPRISALTGANIPALNLNSLTDFSITHWQQLGGLAGVITTWLGGYTKILVALVVSVTIVPVVTFYLLRDWKQLTRKIHALLPAQIEPRVMLIARESDAVIAQFVRGQLILMAIEMVFYSVGLALIGLDLALLLGIIVGSLSIVPYLGLILGLTASLVTAAVQFQEWLPLLLVVFVFGLGQSLEALLLQPLLLGDRIGLHPVAVIFALMAGGQLFGFVGVLLALPVAAVFSVLLRHLVRFYQENADPPAKADVKALKE